LALRRITAKLSCVPVTSHQPAATILPSGWIFTSLTTSGPVLIEMMVVPPLPKELSRVPFGAMRLNVESCHVGFFDQPPTTMLPSAWRASEFTAPPL
jgi:hypothetical protein